MINVDLIQAKASALGLSFAALERRADIANGVIRKWAENSPNLETVKKVADVLGCTVDDLLVKEVN